VLPPIARLTPEQAMYYFLSGYTAKVAGTERGLGNEPVATFSACFAAPFLPRNPSAYAQLLGKKLRRTEAQCWLVNTGWIGGPHGVGQRIWLRYTRAMLKAALAGGLSGVQFKPHPVFGFDVPLSCPDVPADVLDARGQWKNPAAYDSAAKNLQKLFDENYKKFQPA
jgi:phosphoenolpyruvate carboxykinase (ATP)